MSSPAAYDTVFLHPDAATSSDSGSPLAESGQAPSLSPSRLPRLARSPAIREKQPTRFNPYARSRKPRASLAVRVDLPSPAKTGLPTPVSAALKQLEDYDYESEAEVSMLCGDEDTITAEDTGAVDGEDEAGPNDSIASYYFSAEADNLVESTSSTSLTPDSPILATPVAPSVDVSDNMLAASLASSASDPLLLVTPAEKQPTTAEVDATPTTLPSTGSLFRFPSTMNLNVNRLPSTRSLSDTLAPYSSWPDAADSDNANDNLPLLYNAVLRGVRAEDLRAIAADATSEEAAAECIERVAGELFAYAARVAKGEAEGSRTEKEGEGMRGDEIPGQAGVEGGGWWFSDAWRAWRTGPSATD
ncbi:unnamed protein product [Peniophora sp. CBMAI 1063]|nr:unnamed protein product [Peniophora sp. CBMAI 1063]